MRGGFPASSRTPSWAPLALTLGLHLLLVLAWLLRPGVQGPAAPGERETVLVMLAPPPPRPAPAVVTRPTVHPRLAPRVRTPASPAQPPVAETAAAQPISPPVEADTEAETEATSAPLPGDLLASSRRIAGRVGRELGNGAGPLSAEPERKWERFASTVASARVDAGHGVSLDSYTAPDGVTVYRKTVGNRVRCYRSGSVGGINPSDGQSAGNIACPAGVRWTRL